MFTENLTCSVLNLSLVFLSNYEGDEVENVTKHFFVILFKTTTWNDQNLFMEPNL